MTISILAQIAQTKREEVKQLYLQHSLHDLQALATPSPLHFYRAFRTKADQQQPFVIAEFKRKSPSEGWINTSLSVQDQVKEYARRGASAVSVLTDGPYFGGSFDDLKAAADALEGTGVLKLQKDFVIDPIQIYLARIHGANLILLIAAILEPEQMQRLREVAESLGMGVLAEVHSLEEYQKIAHLNFPIIGVNNRDLSTFKTSLNCCNYIARHIEQQGLLVAESGMGSALHLRIASLHAKGFLIGTSLMRQATLDFHSAFNRGHFLKACGIRTQGMIHKETADLIGINFSPISKRRGEEGWLDGQSMPDNAVAVFKGNSAEDVLNTMARHKFQYVQLYAEDFNPAFVKGIKQRVIMAISVKSEADLDLADQYAPYIDCFILDGAQPGSGEAISFPIPADFPYPFFLAGGMNHENAHRAKAYQNCIGIDTASGIESNGQVDMEKIRALMVLMKSW